MNDLYRVFSDPVRRRALRLLGRGPLCVCDLVDALRLPQPTVSRHLATLSASGLVRMQKRGRWRHYALAGGRDALSRRLLASLAHEKGAAADAARLRLKARPACG
jgi:ArsR family transcriptional regulator